MKIALEWVTPDRCGRPKEKLQRTIRKDLRNRELAMEQVVKNAFFVKRWNDLPVTSRATSHNENRLNE